MNLNEHYLWASLVWSSVGGGYWAYGKKQTSMAAMLGGVAIVAVSWLIMSALVMSLVSIGLMVAIYYLIQQGY
jgi:hypothetical protein